MATPPADRPDRVPALAGVRVLICRPEPEAQRLADAFISRGAETECLPMIERQPLPETPEQREQVQNLDLVQHCVVVSPFAARLLLEKLDTWWPQLPVGIRWYAVGRGTAAVLEEAGIAPRIPDSGADSEALLALPALQQVQGDRVLIVRGDRGRELIRETLIARGASVSLLPLYTRRCPSYPADILDARLGAFAPRVVVTLSGETLNNFIALSQNSGHNCRHCLLLVPVARVAEHAREAGFNHVAVPDAFDDHALVDAVIRALQQQPGNPAAG